MPTTATITTTHKASNNRGLGIIMTNKKKATSKKKKTIEQLAERAQAIISKYDIKPFIRNELYGNL